MRACVCVRVRAKEFYANFCATSVDLPVKALSDVSSLLKNACLSLQHQAAALYTVCTD